MNFQANRRTAQSRFHDYHHQRPDTARCCLRRLSRHNRYLPLAQQFLYPLVCRDCLVANGISIDGTDDEKRYYAMIADAEKKVAQALASLRFKGRRRQSIICG